METIFKESHKRMAVHSERTLAYKADMKEEILALEKMRSRSSLPCPNNCNDGNIFSLFSLFCFRLILRNISCFRSVFACFLTSSNVELKCHLWREPRRPCVFPRHEGEFLFI